MTTTKGYVDADYLGAAARLAMPAKRLSWERLEVGPGDVVLDVGCGPGTDTIPLAEIVAPGGRVVGVDHDAEMVARAQRRAEEAGLGGSLEHRRADAYALPFEDASFDAVRSERLLQHLEAPERALAEMVRVAKPGGRVVVLDTDWGSRSVDAGDVDAERRLARVLADDLLVNGYSGRRLPGMARRAGLVELRVEPVPLVVTDYGLWRALSRMEAAEAELVRSGALSEAEVRRLDDDLRARDAEGAFFSLTCLVMVSGRKPAP